VRHNAEIVAMLKYFMFVLVVGNFQMLGGEDIGGDANPLYSHYTDGWNVAM
jgi:hypothetical protein